MSTTKARIVVGFVMDNDSRHKVENEIADLVANGFASIWTRSYKETDSGR